MRFAYLAALLASTAGTALVDRRWRLLFWHDARRSAVVVVSGVVLLLAADVIGIANGLFFRAPTRVMTGLVLAPELPVEEPVFLAFLCYLAMLLVRGTERLLASASDRRAPDERGAAPHVGGRP